MIRAGVGKMGRAAAGMAGDAMAGAAVESLAGAAAACSCERTDALMPMTATNTSGIGFMGKAGRLSFLVDGELESRVKTTTMAFGRLPEGRRLGHAPPPPRPFGRGGGIVAVDAARLT